MTRLPSFMLTSSHCCRAEKPNQAELSQNLLEAPRGLRKFSNPVGLRDKRMTCLSALVDSSCFTRKESGYLFRGL
jgi:hypothetical protein